MNTVKTLIFKVYEESSLYSREEKSVQRCQVFIVSSTYTVKGNGKL